MTEEQCFPYALRPLPLVLGAMFFGLGGAILLRGAAAGAPMRLFPLPIYVEGGPVYLASVASFVFTAVAVYVLAMQKRFGPRALVLTEEWIEAPRAPALRAVVRLHRADVCAASWFVKGSTRIVRIATPKEKLTISGRFVGEDGITAVEAWLSRPA